jgi:hypothetical protein
VIGWRLPLPGNRHPITADGGTEMTNDRKIELIPPFVREDHIQHVTPCNDLREHVHDSRGKCWCKPSVEPSGGGWLVVHNSLNGREFFEDGRRRSS